MTINNKSRDKNRIPVVMNKIEQLWLLNPDLRFGQVYALVESKIKKSINPYYAEEDLWLKAINELIIEQTKK